MAAPVLTAAAQRLFGQFAPVGYDDTANGDALAWLCQAYATAFNQLYDVQVDEPVPWAKLMDADTCPVWALEWLAQFNGVTLASESTEAQKRAAITSLGGQQRGNLTVLRATAQQYLSGNKSVTVLERDSSPYHLTVVTYESETPVAAATRTEIGNALQAQKPAGLVLVYRVDPGWSVGEVETSIYTTVASIEAAFATVQAVESKIPS